MTDKDNVDRVEQDRRLFLRGVGVAVPPTMVMLLSTSLVSPAIAASGGGGGGGGGEFFAPLALPLVGVAATQAGGPAAAPLVAGAAPVPSSGMATSTPGPGPVLGSTTGGAPPVLAAAPPRGKPPATGRVAPPPRRALAIRKAGERG
ncbi:hypothetical protein [Phenylobacterium sp.]|uniref:hypothetical protein n=1 Tax=Phenylobacterium sp. TaxID=1871053 RepID=UPI002CBADE1A|nr:hypothetical protein [Phenylobacterium sp.]HVI30569.1 hypothetical protein [Phenylobacterium sp.]